MLSSLITNKLLLAILGTILAVAGAISAVAAYEVHQANAYQRHLQKGLTDMNKQKPANQYKLP